MQSKKKQKSPAESVKTLADEGAAAMLGPIPEEVSPTSHVDSSPPATPATAPAVPGAPAALTPIEQPNPKPEQPSEPIAPEPEDPDTVDAIDDIVAKEGDEVLAAEDAAISSAFKPEVPKKGLGPKLKAALAWWWHNKLARWSTIILILAGIIGAAVVPQSRYFVLNTVGVRSGVSATVYDDSSQQPLKNVQVRIANQVGKTDGEGRIKLTQVKLGATQMIVERRAFAAQTKRITVGWGSNPLGDVRLRPTGTQYVFMATDFLSAKPLQEAEATTGQQDTQATADDKGKIVLTVEGDSDADLAVTIKSAGYRDEVLTFHPDDRAERQVHMAPARRHAFISKRTGKFDVYAIDVDGKNERKLLAGTGSERDDLTLVFHPTANMAALVSTRGNNRNKEGYLLSNLTILDTNGEDVTNLDQSERIHIVGWASDRLVYVLIASGTSAATPKRHRLMSYNYKNAEKKELASSNYLNDVQIAGGAVYYAPAASPPSPTGLFKVNADGTVAQTLLNKEVWNIIRTGPDQFSLSVGPDWYNYALGDLQAGKVSGPPANTTNRRYRDSPDKLHSAWIDTRDGKGVLLSYATNSKTDTLVRTQSGLTYPVYWLANTYLVYRIRTEQETADYVINTDGGEPRKVRDVTNTPDQDNL